MKWTKIIDGITFKINVYKDRGKYWVRCHGLAKDGIHATIAPLPKNNMTESEVEKMLFQEKWLDDTDSYSTDLCC